ncbi:MULTISPECIES: TrkH family potassium uptake protein [Halobacterium]|uniref:TRK potassium uptake system protein n=6 Tax=Halobacterium salinarum TaxID=2242 RepID=Q9HQ81_HALSA|nr:MULTISPECIES: TrkH family potassium uptake protein [Halobacterium]AAG19635.1 TRK potassium uptake system protein [Halobacterium salinarum NRC-1]MBB6090325.1 trk system potassium uptake protein TrkH [Halobacterium salinarum]MCF2165144.1 TrkH family potassium uptake protein [Halobacterium salinarum]MCF2168047.1 TrkH family potassium uptake protein [Halobacterium salinarum]MCF2239705.1 TrkH family potassium uptake protein [Halobacterium salinarum]
MVDRLGTIARDLGRMLEALAGLIFVSVLVPLVWGEFWVVPAMVVSGLIPLVVGLTLRRTFEHAADPGRLHGMMIAASGWFLVAAFGSVPFLLAAWTAQLDPGMLDVPARFTVPGTRTFSTLAAFQNPLNGFFESMSGFTGTGLTMADNEAALPHTLQWWRSFIEWVGGVGVIVLTTAILARPGSGSLTLYESEARSEKIHPSIVSTVRTIWWIFLLFTFFSILLLWIAGMPMWDAINHAMTGLATGGFSITDNSIATYGSAAIDFALIPVMVLGSIAFPIHYLVLQGDLRNLYTDLQTRWVFGFFALGTALLTAVLLQQGYYVTESVAVAGVVLHGSAATLFQTVRYALFQFVSAASCTGFQTAGALGSGWTAPAQLTVAFGMVVGAAAGSTVGGIKLIRLLTLVKGILFRIRGVFYPSDAVRTFRLDGRALSDTEAAQEFEEAAIITFLWLVFLGVAAFVFMLAIPMGPDAYTVENVLFEVASAQGNVGLSSGITGPGMPTVTKAMFLFNMWIGRLEIIPVLVLLRGLFSTLEVYD